ncbi:bifunctional indole-3-glycerol-phosphate synthase TrpC/phosphoribosylanthranilate isomerase TrpF [Alteromonas sp. CYL-A6]|uniref:bifunctional indole-3-glycerol-phosphate synthase TrpC/phosphoribosylanthranilate isomerase TrpF n=1 Tax=Alteromonas nitratireducens TaxID=3390813 RepID=UPI0034BBADBE
MADVLKKIVEDKRDVVAQLKQLYPLDSLKQTVTPSTKSLFAALSKPDAGFIFECKKASPSKGLIRSPFDLDEIIAAYTPFAAGISVLTDEKYFQGSYDYLAYITERVAQPVLNKDFFIDEHQVYLARHFNADAVLLMLSVLSDDEYRALAEVATSLKLDILTEVSNEEEMHRAIALEANIIGINNRNLRDLSTDLATTEKLVPLLHEARHDYVVISESGIYTHDDVLRLAPHCQGFLVGSALMAQPDLARAVKSLVFGAVKVCGITSPADAQSAFDAGASYAGLIFAEKSPRYVTPEQARAIVSATPGNYVGVFVNETPENVAALASALNLQAVQLHGGEDTAYRQALSALLPADCEIWQAVGVSGELPDIMALTAEPEVNRVLLDCRVGDKSGGTGQQFDWTLLSQIKDLSCIVLAGGIGVDNVVDAMNTGAGMIDVNSGAESAPGKKSNEKLARLFARLRQY